MATLSHDEARKFYDRFGSKQDAQAYYEEPAITDLIEHGDFEHAHNVFELGCGTGRLAAHLLDHHLPLNCQYRGVDLSSTMVELSRARFDLFKDRAAVSLSNGSMKIDAREDSVDRIVSTYVLDLLSDEDIMAFISEAERVLTSNGRLCLAGLTDGSTLLSSVLSKVWGAVHRIRPSLVGGCRPLKLQDYFPEDEWESLHHCVVTPYGIASEVLVVAPRSRGEKTARLAVGYP